MLAAPVGPGTKYGSKYGATHRSKYKKKATASRNEYAPFANIPILCIEGFMQKMQMEMKHNKSKQKYCASYDTCDDNELDAVQS